MCKACPIVLSKPSQQCGGNIYLPTGEEMHLEKVNDLLKVAGDFTGIWAPGFHQGCPLHVPPAIRAGIQKEGVRNCGRMAPRCKGYPFAVPLHWVGHHSLLVRRKAVTGHYWPERGCHWICMCFGPMLVSFFNLILSCVPLCCLPRRGADSL